jgi:phenylpyruvate tautomerase PptA (4-oxalocrotonate tautomerase family)
MASKLSFACKLPPVQRTAEEKARILARLTLLMASLGNEERANDGNA